MFSAASVCLSVCQHDKFRTIKRRMVKLGGKVQRTKISPEFECQGQRSNVKEIGDKKRQCGILFGSRPLRRRPRAAFFSAAVLGALLCRWENQRMLSSLEL